MLRFTRPTFKASASHPVYRHGPTFDGAGANAFVYEQQTTNPLFDVRGAGKIPMRSFRTTSQPVIYPGQRGITGNPIITGQLVTSPLYKQ